jgi:hypothetical protein
VNVGTHRLWARKGQIAVEGRSFRFVGGETARVEFKLVKAAPKMVAPPKPVFWAGWATTAALAAGATFTGFQAMSAHHDYQETYGAIGTSRAELDQLDARATGWSVATDVLGGAAIVVAAYSIYVTLRAPTPRATSTGTATLQLGSRHPGLSLSF